MGRFISNFQTTAELEAFSATTNFGRPHVSLTKDNSVVHYFTSGIIPEYQWVDDGFTCVGYDKYTKKKKQVSYDGGTTWTDTGIVSAVTLVEANSEYCGYVPPETRLVAKFNVTDTSSPTSIANITSGFSAIEIDDVEQSEVVNEYTFDTAGEHTVKYTLTDPTSISFAAFTDCYSLTSIDIPDSVTSIGENVFFNCTGLTTCTIGDGVTSIGSNAFFNCISLTSVNIPDGVISIGYQTFCNCTGLTSCTIGSGVTTIGNNAFDGCTSLTSIDIPDSVTSIGENAFYNCTGLTTCTIGDDVTSIGASAFYNCYSLTSIVSNATNPPSLASDLGLATCRGGSGSGSGSGEGPSYTIYVPSDSVEAYKSSWSSYACTIEAI